MENAHVDDAVVGSILYCAQGYAALFKRALASSHIEGVTAKTQLDILVSLKLNGEQPMGLLGKRLCKAPEQISRATRSLREAGLITCERDEENRSMVIASLTEKGHHELESYAASMHDSVRALLNKLDPDARAAFIEASLKISEVFLSLKP